MSRRRPPRRSSIWDDPLVARALIALSIIVVVGLIVPYLVYAILGLALAIVAGYIALTYGWRFLRWAVLGLWNWWRSRGRDHAARAAGEAKEGAARKGSQVARRGGELADVATDELKRELQRRK